MAVVSYPVREMAVKRALRELERQLRELAARVEKLEAALRRAGA